MLYHRRLSINKYLEIESSVIDPRSYFAFELKWTRRCDHAGFTVHFELHRFIFDFVIYDNRHWNFKKDRWNKKGEYKKC